MFLPLVMFLDGIFPQGGRERDRERPRGYGLEEVCSLVLGPCSVVFLF